MITTIFTLLLATVTQAQGTTLEIDKGLVDGLRPGDRATIGYTLTVAGESRRIEVATATVTEVSAEHATLELEPNPAAAAPEVRPGLQARFTLDSARTATDFFEHVSGVALTDPAAAQTLLAAWLDRHVGDSGEVQTLLAETLSSRATHPRPNAEIVELPAGIHRIGLDAGEATHYDQQPSFLVHLAPFAIEPTADPATTGATYDEASSACAARGMRLPTEFEWEAAARAGVIETAAFYEWTTSWYQAYPGNERSEADYGETARALRGGDAPGSAAASSMRRFASPTTADARVGFRCAKAMDA